VGSHGPLSIIWSTYGVGWPTAVLTGMVILGASIFFRGRVLYIFSFLAGFVVNAALFQLAMFLTFQKLGGYSFAESIRLIPIDFVAGSCAFACAWILYPIWFRMDGGKQIRNRPILYVLFAVLVTSVVVTVIVRTTLPLTCGDCHNFSGATF